MVVNAYAVGGQRAFFGRTFFVSWSGVDFCRRRLICGAINASARGRAPGCRGEVIYSAGKHRQFVRYP